MSYAQFSLDQIPEIENKQTLNLVAETGFWTVHLKEKMLPQFTAQTGIKVNVITTSLDKMYSLQTESLIEGSGRYDLLTMEAGWAKEWASKGLTVPLSELANLYDPSGERGINSYLEPYYPSLLNILSYHGEIYAIPYNNYVMGNHYRADLFRHPKEKYNFKVKYGYPLAPPTNMQELKDVSAFFTRTKGETLGDNILAKPFYGIALMSGNRPHINDEFSSILWSLNGYWMKPEYNQNQQLTLFKLPPDNTVLIRTANIYQDLMHYAYPANEEFAFKEASNALANGDVAMWPFAYNNLWSASFKVESNVPGARLAVAQVPGGKPYNGAYAFAVAYDSLNPQAAYWLLKYMGSFEAQYAYALGGGNPCRADVATSAEFQTEKLRHIGGAFNASHKANMNWSTEVLSLGHFTSTAMGNIYPELRKSCFKLSNNNDLRAETAKLVSKIEQIQNRYGEVPVVKR
ncbi:extracellular solute-binding protein [Shewanella sp. D64]|uniref:ABC transporter substrate-binding protein n=1 Tax=unclassified Shewanella TaxID=196818 RepID=UPI0022BA39D9|nr:MULTISPECIES: extracellular solute-binding protein [unclassified Shewanella]MEC4726610.1 extracellular solute-binding protein [Shewanella sp. D64]MEC4737349.1 extracellular solute-binding protein [Shewanella sp. E94]WBJ98130.1 extracellular solute-binding protein [Shewanella sp. MTB7]